MASTKFKLFLAVYLTSVHIISCARILGVFPVPSISHQVVFRALTMELARRGHQVTVITPDPIKNHGIPSYNFKQIDVHNISYGMWREMVDFAAFRGTSSEPKDVYPVLMDVFTKIFDAQMQSPEVQAIIGNQTESFDLLILESMVKPNFGFAWRFNAPLIGISSLSGVLSNFDAIGSPSHPVLYPDIFRHRAGELNIWDRMYTVYSDLWIRYQELCSLESENNVARKHFGQEMPTLSSLTTRMDMLFLNVFPMLAGIRPTVPAIVYMGGLHLNQKKKLPEDLQAFLDESSEGVVYMSLGNNVLSKNLPAEKLRLMVDVFRRLPYRVLWKFEGELPDQPANVRISKWLPQQDLLSHPNVKAFITQGGQQSMEEAIRDNVPLIGIPFFADQDLNVQNFVLRGIGVGLNIETLDEETFEKAIHTVIKDPKYKKNMRHLSELLFDQPMSGLERAVWWTEYVLRHRGASHLRAPAAGISLIEYYLLDVIALVFAITAVATLLLAYMAGAVYRMIRGDQSKLKIQ